MFIRCFGILQLVILVLKIINVRQIQYLARLYSQHDLDRVNSSLMIMHEAFLPIDRVVAVLS